MFKKLVIFTIFLLGAIVSWFFSELHQQTHFLRVSQTLIALSITYLIFKVIASEAVARKTKDPKTKYAVGKTLSMVFWIVFAAATIAIWVEDPQALIVAYGIIGAGIALTLQDFFKNIIGGITILMSKLYSVGDRIEVGGEYGDVIDIGLLYTTLMETRAWIHADQVSGRLSMMPNSKVMTNYVNNYTKDHDFIWDEITLPLTYGSDWKKAQELFLKIAKKETKEATEKASKDIMRLQKKYYLQKKDVQPTAYITPTDNWIEVTVRYVTPVRQRRTIHNTIIKQILESISRNKNLKIASSTMDITLFKGKKK